MTPALAPEQKTQLETTGVTRVPGVVDPAAAGRMADAVWEALAARGVDRSTPSTWPVGFVTKHQGLRRRRVFDAFDTERTAAVVDELLGAGMWRARSGWGPALVTFPEPGSWTVPHRMWHLDLPGRGDPDQPSVARLFGCVTDVASHGGATLVIEGSHELVRRMVAASPGRDVGGSSDVRRRLVAAHRWFRALSREGGGDRLRRFMVDGDEIDGVRVRVAELTAKAGDLVVMLPWTVHSMSMNCAAMPRFVVTHTIHRIDGDATAQGPRPWSPLT